MMHRQGHCFLLLARVLGCYIGATVSLLAQSAPASAEIHGILRFQKNKPIASALVTARAIPAAEAARPVTNVSVLTDPNGAFRIVGLEAGTYKLCVMSPKDNVLDPCEWSAAPQTATVAAGGVVSGVDLAVTKGKILKIRIDDPDQVVPTQFQRRPGAFVKVGVAAADGVLHRGRFVSSDRQGHNYEVLVDPKADLKFKVDTYNLDLTDDAKQKVKPNAAVGVKSDDASLEKGFHFSASAPGKKP